MISDFNRFAVFGHAHKHSNSIKFEVVKATFWKKLEKEPLMVKEWLVWLRHVKFNSKISVFWVLNIVRLPFN